MGMVYIEPGRGRSGPPVGLSTNSTGGGRRRLRMAGGARLTRRQATWGGPYIYSISVGP